MKKTLMIMLALVLVIAMSVTGTLAYLTSTTEVVKNTFTVGKVEITLDEAPVDADGAAVAGNRVKANAYQLFPGHKYDKDPTVHVNAASQDCYVFVKVVNGITEIEDQTNTIAAQMTKNGWVALDVEGVENVYYLNRVATKADANLVVFEEFKIATDVDNTKLAEYANATITVTAYAVQEDGFDTAAEAWTAANFS